LRISPASHDIPAFRRAIRQMALARLRSKAEDDWRTAAWQKSPERAERKERKRREAEEARTARRALVHIARGTDGRVAAVVVDVQARTIETWPVSEEFEEMRQWVGPDFQPQRFDIREVNDRLARIGWREAM
jgi:hypothetical protein